MGFRMGPQVWCNAGNKQLGNKGILMDSEAKTRTINDVERLGPVHHQLRKESQVTRAYPGALLQPVAAEGGEVSIRGSA